MRSALLLVPLLAGLAFLPMPASSAPPLACEAPVHVPGQGPSCPAPGGWLLQLPDGRTGFTHGPDPIPTVPLPAASVPVGPDPGLACVEETEPHMRAVYAYPRFGANQFAQKRALMTASILNANAIVYANAMKFDVPMRWKMLCDANDLPLFDVVMLPTQAQASDFYTIWQDLTAMGYGKADEKLVIFFDAKTNCGCGGQSFVPGGDEPDASNPNNYGWLGFSITYLGNYGSTSEWALSRVVLHEETHAMGGVQLSAPHTSGGFHCTDGHDVMCYDDGGNRGAYYHTRVCIAGDGTLGVTQPYDCNHDDYFHPDPPEGSYLATHWNVGAEYNRFLQRG